MKNSNVLIYSAVQSLPGHRETIRAGAQRLEAGVAVTRAGVIAAPGAAAAGVTLNDIEAGEPVAVGLAGVCVMKVTAPAVIDADTPITVGVGGTAAVATGTDVVMGKSMDYASGASVASPRFIRVFITA